MNFVDATELRDAVRARKVKAVEAVAGVLARAKAANGSGGGDAEGDPPANKESVP